MRNIEQQTGRTIFCLFILAQYVIPLASISSFRDYCNYPVRTIFYHLLLVTFGYVGLFAAAAALATPRPIRSHAAARYVLPLTWGSFSVVLYFTYLLAWCGRLGVGMNLSVSMVAPYVLHPSLVFSTLPISPAAFWTVLVVIPIIILLAYGAAASAFAGMLLRMRVRLLRATRTPRSPARPRRFITSTTGVLAAGIAMFSLCPPNRPLGMLYGDPIFLSLRQENPLLPITELGTASDIVRNNYAPPSQFQRKNVILIVVDALRADHLGVMGYLRDTTPFLDSLQRTGSLRMVKSFYSASCCSFGGILSLLRSQHWFKMTRRAFALQDVLKKAGYRVHFVLSGDHARFQDLKLFYGNSLDSFSDGATPGRHFSLNDDRGVVETFESIAPYDGKPAFVYFHMMSVHPLGLRLPENIKYQPASIKRVPENYINNYDNGIIQADNNIRELFTQLKQKGFLQNSLVIITGDHGESLGERNLYGHSTNLYAEEVTPPLMIYDCEPVDYRNLDLARQIDVAPTIIDRLGLPIPASWDGHSLLHDEPQRFSYLRMADLYAVIDHTPARTLKYMYDANSKKEEIYDVVQDPHEQRDIFRSTDAREIQELRMAISAFSIHPGT